MKWVKRILIVLVVLIVIVVVAVTFFLGNIVKSGVRTAGPKVMGVPVTLADADISVFSGKVKLKDLVIGNPEGFKTPSAFEMGEFWLVMDMPSLMSDRINIKEIIIDGPVITLEASMKGTNLGALQKGIAERTAGEEAPAMEGPEEEAPAKPGKKVVIDTLVVQNGKIRLSSGLMMGNAVTIPLPPVRINDIGKEKGGTSIAEATTLVLKQVLQAAGQAVTSSGKLVGKGLNLAGDTALKGVNMAGDAASKGVDMAGDAASKGLDVAGKGAEAATEGAKAAAGAAMEGAGAAGDAALKAGGAVGSGAIKAGGAVGGGAKKAGEAVGTGAKKLLGGMGGLLKKSKPEATNETEAVENE